MNTRDSLVGSEEAGRVVLKFRAMGVPPRGDLRRPEVVHPGAGRAAGS